MRNLCLVLILLAVTVSVRAHDIYYGIMNCYDGKHCPQDTLVFGIITGEDAGTFTVNVHKVLRGKETRRDIRIGKTGWSDPFKTVTQPKVGHAIVVSYLRQRRMPLKPVYLTRSKTGDWRMMELDTQQRCADAPTFERFVRSGGTDDDFYFDSGKAYLRKDDGSVELIYSPTAQPVNQPIAEPVPAEPVPAVNEWDMVKVAA